MYVSFAYSPELRRYDFGPGHPLRPERLTLTHDLLSAYGAFGPDGWLETVAPRPAAEADVAAVHAPEYLDVLRRLPDNPEGLHELRRLPDAMADAARFGLGTPDTPVFPGLWESSLLVAGATLAAAEHVRRTGGRALSPAGGLHHAGRARASGFCVLNDPAVAIARLLRSVDRVAYVDIDAHHGDGVQEIFYAEPRVLTISLHESGRTLFPGTGDPEETGAGEGRGTSLNVPLRAGTDDETYLWAFDAVVPRALERFRPDVLVTQCGADAHAMDPLAHLGLTTAAYEAVFARYEALGLPWLATGGGGYNLRVTPRVWALLAAAMARHSVPDAIPPGLEERLGPSLRDAPPELDPSETRDARAFAEESVQTLERALA